MATMDPSLLSGGDLQGYKAGAPSDSVECLLGQQPLIPRHRYPDRPIGPSSPSPPLRQPSHTFTPYPNAEASSSTMQAPASSADADSQTARRGRGRPKGSKNKPKDRNAPDYKPTKGEL